MTMPNQTNASIPRTYYLAILFLPFFIFYWIAPFISKYTLGNDYCFYPIQNQMYLLFSLKTGSFPLFIPGFDIGHSFSALTLGQIFHPITHIAAMLPGYWQGQALEWNTVLRLLSLGLSQCLLFALLIRMNLRPGMAFPVSFITTYNLRMLDLFRYGASLEAFTAHLMLIATLGLWYLQPRAQKHAPLLVILLTYMLAVSGHPQMMYYAFLATILFVFFLPFYTAIMVPGHRVDVGKTVLFFGKTGILLGAGVLLASAYIVPFYFDFILTNSTRVGRDISWATSHSDTWLGAWGNFFSPLLSNLHGAFGASSLISLAALIPVLALFRMRVPKTIWAIWLTLIGVFLCAQGGRTPLYPLFWKYFPFADSFRVPGRIAFLMPMLIMLLLAWLVNAQKTATPALKHPPLKILAAAALLVTALFNGFLLPQLGSTPETVSAAFSNSLFVFGLKDHFLAESDIFLIYLMTIWAGLILLFLFMLPSKQSSRASIITTFICVFTVLQVVLVLRHGTYYRTKRDTLTFAQALKQNRINLSYFYYPGFGLASAPVSSHLQESFKEPYLAKIYKQVIPVPGRRYAYEQMKKNMTPQTAYIEAPVNRLPDSLLKGSTREEGGRIHLNYSSYNRLQFTAQTPAPALFGLAYPYSDYWQARVNGREAATYRINGLYVGLLLPQGQNRIDLRYFSPPAFWGMGLSCLGLFIIGAYFCLSALTGFRRLSGLLCVTLLSLGTFQAWQTSLYAGENIGTVYDWTYTPSSEHVNKAYGKPVAVSASLPEFQSMSVVDGDRRPNSGFVSKFQKTPTLRIDLQQTTPIKKIVLFEAGNRPTGVRNNSLFGLFIDQISKYVNIRPLVVDVSEDGQHWQTVATVGSPKKPGEPVVVTFEKPRPGRYLRVRSPKNVLGFDEIEIY